MVGGMGGSVGDGWWLVVGVGLGPYIWWVSHWS